MSSFYFPWQCRASQTDSDELSPTETLYTVSSNWKRQALNPLSTSGSVAAGAAGAPWLCCGAAVELRGAAVAECMD
ncbi:MAG: hypothetical protein GY862_34395 [Gammaproteobacteria bacterium]|nr:hypothetical protein [Gammaproteobacteria bacterium]